MLPITKYTDYRDFLNAAFEKRSQANAAYSLRAMARDLGLKPQNLSKILKKEAGISVDSSAQVAKALGLNYLESTYFCDMVLYSGSKSPELRRLLEQRLSSMKQASAAYTLTYELEVALSDWRSWAILELIQLSTKKNQKKFIAERLNSNESTVEKLLERLVYVKLLEVKNSRYVKAKKDIQTTYDIPSSTIRALHAQLLEKAKTALDKQTVDERDVSCMITVIDPSKLPEAKRRLREFRTELTRFLETGNLTQVYCISSQLFRLC